MKKLTTAFATLALSGSIAAGSAQAGVVFSFTESGGNVLMNSSGTLDTSAMVAVTVYGWDGTGVQVFPDPEHSSVMGDSSMGIVDASFAFNDGTDLSPWYSNMFTTDVFGWASTGTTQFATYAYDSVNFAINPGISLATEDLVGDLWTPDVSWSIAGTFASLGITEGTYTITDAVSGEFISIQIGGATSSVPAPASIALLGLGLAGIGFFRRKKAA
ncbi:MAG: hypothetical protein CSA53_07270 [Gammaproteobacteria bacterium]|nr:MAG: hypothetical protein CSA53_07270 [Gammaproteobacteria bacterium]